MSVKLTKDCLVVISDSEEVVGVYFLGFFIDNLKPNIDFPEYLWNVPISYTSFKLIDIDYNKWVAIEWKVIIKDCFPSNNNWQEIIKNTMQYILDKRAVISWIGLEGGFADPPSLFDPKSMDGQVYAFLTNQNEFKCASNIDDEFKVIDNETLIRLNNFVNDLINIS